MTVLGLVAIVAFSLFTGTVLGIYTCWNLLCKDGGISYERFMASLVEAARERLKR